MASLKDSFSKGLTTINLKTSNFMEENKIKSYISTLDEEKNNALMQIAQTIYTQWKAGNVDVSAVETLLQTVKAKEEEIANQKEKIVQLQVQEEQILGKKPAQEAETTRFCPVCGAQNNAKFKFCYKCGKPLE